jgi:resuscitation-promoting factor RpfB
MAREINGLALGSIAVGGVFIYAAIKGVSVLLAARSIVTGQDPSKLSQTHPITPPPDSTTGGPTGEHAGPGGGGSPSLNKALGKQLAAQRGWTGAEWDALDALWERESGWSNTADTRKSGLDPPDASVFAYGVAQARNYTKYPKAGWPEDKGGRSDTRTQEVWGLDYIQGRYGSPVMAKAHEDENGWY